MINLYERQAEILRFLPNVQTVSIWNYLPCPLNEYVYVQAPGEAVGEGYLEEKVFHKNIAIDAFKEDTSYERPDGSRFGRYAHQILFSVDGPDSTSLVIARYLDLHTWDDLDSEEQRAYEFEVPPSIFLGEISNYDNFIFTWTRKQFLKDFGGKK